MLRLFSAVYCLLCIVCANLALGLAYWVLCARPCALGLVR